MLEHSDVIVLGAGPYGLSIAAHLTAAGIPFRIFGRPLQTWREHMPDGMLLKSDGFATNLSDPAGAFSLARFCAMSGIPYDDTRRPVSLETFRAYGLAFQKAMVAPLEEKEVAAIEPLRHGFRVSISDGTRLHGGSVVVAAGISHFAHVPESLQSLPHERLCHSADVKEPARWRGRRVTVVGAGASAVDLAVLLREAGVDVTLVARRSALKFAGPPPANGRTLLEQLRHPTSPIGPGWRSRLYCDMPWLFRWLPEALRLRIVRGHLAPAAGYPMRERFVGKVPALLGCDIVRAELSRGEVRLSIRTETGTTLHATDHVIAATGYQVDVSRLPFLDAEIVSRIRCVDRSPALSADFESSVPGLFFVGAASVNTFGPMMRFTCGADWTARRLTRALVARSTRRTVPATEAVAR